METTLEPQLKLPPAGTYVKFQKTHYPAKRNQLARISEDGKSVGIWYCGWPVYINNVDPNILRVVTKTQLKKMKK